MTLLDGYRSRTSGATSSGFDELLSSDGHVRPGWDSLALETWDAASLRSARGLASRLLEDDGVTYNPVPDGLLEKPSEVDHAAGERWRLDPLPAVIEAETWSRLERGIAQRNELLEAVVADLYGARRLLTSGLIPPELVWRHDGYLRPAWGSHKHSAAPRIVLAATDLGRSDSGEWQVIMDRTQAPSGLGYAMENRRVVARVLPDGYRTTELRRLSGFFSQVRDALVEAAPTGVEDPRVVVLTPGRHSETAFDHAFLASLLGFGLVTGSDLTMRDGRVWMRELGELKPVDVVIRRVDDTWCDPLELRPESQLGVPGLLEAGRRGSVAVANALGSGVVENPALHALLPRLCESLLDEALRLPSAPSWWCGDPKGLSHVLVNLDKLMIRSISRSDGRGVFGPGLDAKALDTWRSRITADPGRFVGQSLLPLSTTPTVSPTGLSPRALSVRAFAVATQGTYAVMPGGLGRITPVTADSSRSPRERVLLTKDVWVLKGSGMASELRSSKAPEQVKTRRVAVAMVPRALEDLFWLGRYSARVEDLTRTLLVVRAHAADFPHGGDDPGHAAVDVLAGAITHITATYPGLAGTGRLSDVQLIDELRNLILDSTRPGSIGHSLRGLEGAAADVRDQLSTDVFLVLGSMDRACSKLYETPGDVGSQLLEIGVEILSGILALSGITAENMVRDVGWHLLDLGRGLERALQTVALMRWTLGEMHAPAVEAHLVSGVLTASESVLTHRRRYGGAQRVDTMLDLLLVDGDNPRSVAFQIERIRARLDALPGVAENSRLHRLVDELARDLALVDVRALAEGQAYSGGAEALLGGSRFALVELCDRIDARLRGLAEAVEAQFFWHPTAPRPLGTMVLGGRR